MKSPIYRRHISAFLIGTALGMIFIASSNTFLQKCTCEQSSPITIEQQKETISSRLRDVQTSKNNDGTFLMPMVYDDDRDIVKMNAPLNVIPPILHLQWKDRRLPIVMHKYLEAWHRLHPSWRIFLWTDKDIARLFNMTMENNNRWERYIKTFKHPILRVDFSRYLILYLFGGIYSDIDNLPLQNLDPVLQHHSCVLAREPEAYNVAINLPASTLLVSNVLMASSSGHAFWLMLMEKIIGRKDAHPIEQVGPFAMTEILRELNRNIGLTPRMGAVFLAPTMYFYPPVNEARGGDEGHKKMLRWRCRGLLKKSRYVLSIYARHVCQEIYRNNTINSVLAYSHPRTFFGPFSRHTQFTSWATKNLTSKHRFLAIERLDFKIHAPDSLLDNHQIKGSALHREKRIMSGALV